MSKEIVKIRKEIEAYCVEHGISHTQFGIESTGRRELMTRLRKNYGLNFETYARIRAYIDSNGKKKFRAPVAEMSMSA